MFKKLASWWRGGDKEYTIACDISPFYHWANSEEQLFYRIGLKSARRFARRWVRTYTSGQARILEGHLTFDKKENNAQV